jgi:hypothetical protein
LDFFKNSKPVKGYSAKMASSADAMHYRHCTIDIETCDVVVCMETPGLDTEVVGASSWGVMETVETQDPHTSSTVCAGWAPAPRVYGVAS